jgi:5'-3' exonuclease
MRLKKAQKEALLSWIAEGLRTDECNERAALFDPPFSVSRQQVDHYRETRKVDLAAIERAAQMDALTEGLALKEVRVSKLQQLAALMERDLFGGFLWTEEIKGVGQGAAAQIVEYESFNSAEVDAYRGVLDDIAKEVGGRKADTSLTATVTVSHTFDDALSKVYADAP